MRKLTKGLTLAVMAVALAISASLAFAFAAPKANAADQAVANPTTFFGNLVENGDFETVEDGRLRLEEQYAWAGCYLQCAGATLEQSGETAYFGEKSLKAVIGPSAGISQTAKRFDMRFGNMMAGSATNLESGKYLIRAYVKGTAGAEITFAITGITNATWVPVTVSDKITLASADWQEVKITLDYTAPEAGTAAVDMQVCSSTEAPVYFDGLSVFKTYDVTVSAPGAGTDAGKLTVKDAAGVDVTSQVVIENTEADKFIVKGLYSKSVIVYNGVESETTGGSVGFTPYNVTIKLVDKNNLEVRGEYVSVKPTEGSINFAYDEATASYKAENVMGTHEIALSAPYYYTEYRTITDSVGNVELTVVMQRKDYDSADASYIEGNLVAGTNFDDPEMINSGMWPGMWLTTGSISSRAAFGKGALAAVIGSTDKSNVVYGTSLRYRFGNKAEGWATQGNYLLETGVYKLRGFVRASENTTLTASIAANVGIDVVYAQSDATLTAGWNKIDLTLNYAKPENAAANDLILTADNGSMLYFDAFGLFRCYDVTVTLPDGGAYTDVKILDFDGIETGTVGENGIASGLFGTATLVYNNEKIAVTPASTVADFTAYTPDYIDPATVKGGIIDEGDFEKITQDDFWYAAQSNGKWGIYAASTVEPSRKFAKSGKSSIRFSTHQNWERVAYIVSNIVAPDTDFHIEGWLRRDEKPVIAVPELVIAAADAAGNPIYPDGSLCKIPLYDNDWHKFAADFRYSLNTETSELSLWLNSETPVVVPGVASISQIEFAVRLEADFSGCAADGTDKIRDCGGSAYLDAVVGWAIWDASFIVKDAEGKPVSDAEFEKLTDGFGKTLEAEYDAASGKYIVKNVRGGLTVKVKGTDGGNYVETLMNYNTNDQTFAPEYLLTVKLTNKDGAPLGGAIIRVRAGSESLGTMTETESGVYTMTVSGNVKVMITLDGYRFRTTYDANPQNATLEITGEKRDEGTGGESGDKPAPSESNDGGSTEKKGCRGSVAGLGSLAGIMLVGAMVVLKKNKENR